MKILVWTVSTTEIESQLVAQLDAGGMRPIVGEHLRVDEALYQVEQVIWSVETGKPGTLTLVVRRIV